MSAEWIEKYVDSGDFSGLFIEGLGWSKPRKPHSDIKVDADSETLAVSEVAHYKGIAVWACPVIPAGNIQRAVDTQLRKYSTERIVIFHDDDRQAWRWPQSRDASGAGSPRLVTHDHVVGRGNEALRQRLQLIKIGLDEDPSVVETTRRLRKAFDSDKVTKKFYREFSKQHRLLIDDITGIEDADPVLTPDLRWYGSILLNRLMFIYFMQRKGFLDGDPDYLRNRLARIRALKRPGSFYEFYKDFLIPLFHEGLGAVEGNRQIDDSAIEELLGDIPYVNGGIFSKHPLEVVNDIRVPDDAFEKVFDFFDQWQWHLDDRPTGNPNEVNPDVLGFIFEQFINNREEVAKGNKAAATNADKGAYYTKEDVTGYMTSSTLLPVFLERLEALTGVNPWRLVAADPERYVWASVRHGLDLSLPEEISDDVGKWPRPSWEEIEVPSDFGLPGESWWEVVERRQFAEQLLKNASGGGVDSVDGALASNLDLETLAVDVIDALDNPSDVVATWSVLTELRVIDPTCGSGAFLFAALNILHHLYAATLEAVDSHAGTSRSKELRAIADAAAKHPNTDYFLLKHAALNNIYGVDIMPEAIEIARLRLFLKLIAQIESRSDIEPLPDLEFNIRSGNILVGAVNEADIRERVDLLNYDKVEDIKRAADEVALIYRDFAVAQGAAAHSEAADAKTRLLAVSAKARNQLDEWWFASEPPDARKGDGDLDGYRRRAHPFHWVIEFPEVFAAGGFDVVVGNPPYVGRTKVNYVYSGFKTDGCPDIYAACTERASQICAERGRLAMIVMLSLSFSRDFTELRRALRERFGVVLASSFSRRPSTLFTGAGVRSTIVLCSSKPDDEQLGSVLTTDTKRWTDAYRPHLMASLRYSDITPLLDNRGDQWPRTGDEEVRDLLVALKESNESIARSVTRSSHAVGFKQTALYYLSVYLDEPPAYSGSLKQIEQPKVGALQFHNQTEQELAFAVLAGRIAFTWWACVGDDFDVTSGVLKTVPIDVSEPEPETKKSLLRLAKKLRKSMPQALMYTLYAKKWLGNYDMKVLRPITDEIDEIVLRSRGLEAYLPVIRRVDARLFRSSGDAGNSIRSWPPPAH